MLKITFFAFQLTEFTEKNKKYLLHSQQAIQQGLENAKINIHWQTKFYDLLTSYLKGQKM